MNQVSDCGRYRISKAMTATGVVYTAIRGMNQGVILGNSLGIADADEAKRHCARLCREDAK